MPKKKIKFLIITSQRGLNYTDLTAAIKGLGHVVYTYSLLDVTIRLAEGRAAVYFKNHPLSFFDIIIPRTIQKNLSLGRFILQLTTPKQFILDACISKRDTFGKISQGSALLSAKLSHPQTLYIASSSSLQENLKTIGFPCVAKPVVGSQGSGVFIIKDKKKAFKILSNSDKGYLFQKYLPIKFDYRVFVVGGKVLGGIKRHTAKNDFRTNASVGGKVESIKITAALRSIALKATLAFGYDVSGVDIATVKRKHYVLEVNRSPQWQAFKLATGINPAEHIIRYCIKRYSGR